MNTKTKYGLAGLFFIFLSSCSTNPKLPSSSEYCANLNIVELRKNANLNDDAAQFQLGLSYKNGLCLKKDRKKAVVYFQRSANNENSFAYLELAEAYYFGSGAPRDKAKAMKYYRIAAEAGIPKAQNELSTKLCWEAKPEKLGPYPAVKLEIIRWWTEAYDAGYVYDLCRGPLCNTLEGVSIDDHLRERRKKRVIEAQNISSTLTEEIGDLEIEVLYLKDTSNTFIVQPEYGLLAKKGISPVGVLLVAPYFYPILADPISLAAMAIVLPIDSYVRKKSIEKLREGTASLIEAEKLQTRIADEISLVFSSWLDNKINVEVNNERRTLKDIATKHSNGLRSNTKIVIEPLWAGVVFRDYEYTCGRYAIQTKMDLYVNSVKTGTINVNHYGKCRNIGNYLEYHGKYFLEDIQDGYRKIAENIFIETMNNLKDKI